MREPIKLNYTLENGQEISLTISRANGLMGMRRSIAAARGFELSKETEDEATKVMLKMTYPDLVSSVSLADGFEKWPISFEEFINMPDDLIVLWEAATYEMNPHWNPALTDALAEKKIKKSTEESPGS